MAMIKCSECGKEISSRAAACPFCGCPVAVANDGVLRVELASFLKLIGNIHLEVTFEGQTVRLNRGYYHDFVVPADGITRTCKISCQHGVFDSCEMNISVNSGERKRVLVIFNDGKFGTNKWQYRTDSL